jgi:outer membrane protein TolC
MAMNSRSFRQFALVLSALAVCLGGCHFSANLHTAAIEHPDVKSSKQPQLLAETKSEKVEKRLSKEMSKIPDVSVASHQLSKDERSKISSQSKAGPLLVLKSQGSSSDSDDSHFDEDVETDVEQVNMQGKEPEQLDVESASEFFPVDFPTALRLAGADNWNVQLARERVQTATARYDAARVLWLPTINAGIGYTKHDGQIQRTLGPVVDVSRNSFFVGGGAKVSGAPLAGGSGGPARLQVDLSLADAIFKPLAACQLVHAAAARETATFNDTLLQASLAYIDLVEAQGQFAVAQQNLTDAEELRKLSEAFVASGKGSQADISRVLVETSSRRQDEIQARMRVQIASAELARVLQLDLDKLGTSTTLVATENQPVPLQLVFSSANLSELVSQAHSSRPELAEQMARIAAAQQNLRAERYRPFVPNIHVGTSAGGFGGGVNDNLHQLDGRSDVDILAVWQLDNLGLGNRAAKDERRSQFRLANIEFSRTRDLITTEVTQAYHQVQAEHQRMQLAQANVEQADDSYRRNLLRIEGLEGLPLEALQAVQAVASARRNDFATIAAYNRAQAQLLRAIGSPIEADDEPVPAEDVPLPLPLPLPAP